MTIKKYQNELIIFITLLLMIGAYIYRSHHISEQRENGSRVNQSLLEAKKAIKLKKIWANKALKKKVDILQNIVAPSKVTWHKGKKKLSASYQNLGPNELNKLVTKILNIPVSITLLDVKKVGSTYNMEFKCKW